MTPACLVAMLALAAPPEDYTIVVRNGTETRAVRLTISAGGESLAIREARLLNGHRPTADGETPLDRILKDGRLLRVESRPPHPHVTPVHAALLAVLDLDRNGTIEESEWKTAEETLLRRFDADDDRCLIPLEIVPDLPNHGSKQSERISDRYEVKVFQPGETLPQNAAFTTERLTVSIGSNHRQRVTVAGIVLDVAAPTVRGGKSDRPKSLLKPGREKELKKFDEVAAAVITLTIRPQARGLFELLDRDGDGQLSVRELRAASSLKDDQSQSALPHFSLTLTAGSSVHAPVPLIRTPNPTSGPVWFQSLDRNGDGDLDRREFIGTDAQFRSYDANKDGLISACEAEAGDKQIRAGAKP